MKDYDLALDHHMFSSKQRDSTGESFYARPCVICGDLLLSSVGGGEFSPTVEHGLDLLLGGVFRGYK